MRKRMM